MAFKVARMFHHQFIVIFCFKKVLQNESVSVKTHLQPQKFHNTLHTNTCRLNDEIL